MRTMAKMNRYPMSCHIIVEDETLYRKDQKRMRRKIIKDLQKLKNLTTCNIATRFPPSEGDQQSNNNGTLQRGDYNARRRRQPLNIYLRSI